MMGKGAFAWWLYWLGVMVIDLGAINFNCYPPYQEFAAHICQNLEKQVAQH